MIINRLPYPLNLEEFDTLKEGIDDNNNIKVLVNEKHDFCCLDPLPKFDYIDYIPRVKKLNLEKYKNNTLYFKNRLKKLPQIEKCRTIVEIGASDGSFLEVLDNKFPGKKLFAIEPDTSTKINRENRGILSFDSIEDFIELNKKVDLVCLFHVFEHIVDPKTILHLISQILNDNGLLIIEVPSLTDPLISLYKIPEFLSFYYQSQHPYVYTATSLSRVLESNGFDIISTIPFQRYGLENHVSWLKNKLPGGDGIIQKLLKNIDLEFTS